MLTFRFNGADGCMVNEETLTSGMVGKEIKLEFSSDWDGWSKIAVFTAGHVTRDAVVVSDVVQIPAEVLATPTQHLYVGIYGISAEGNVTPTIRVKGPKIKPGTDPSGDEGTTPDLPVWAQLQQQIDNLRGDNPQNGSDGITPHIGENGNWYLDDTDTGVNARGEDGRGILSISRTAGTGAAGTIDTYTITYSDDTTSTYTVYNGKDGSDGLNADQVSHACADKKILFLGDSITASSSGWTAKIADILKPALSVNVAVAGAHWCDYSNTEYDGNPVFDGADNNVNNVIGNQVEKILRGKDTTHANYSEVADYADFDIIFIAAGTNDSDPSGDIEASFYADGSVVDVTSVDRTTWHGAFRYCVEKLQRVYPDAKIFICTPIQAVESKRSYASIKAKGNYLKQLCARMSVNCIDTMLCGICGLYEVADATGRDLQDGLHTNDSGALKMAKYNAMMVMNYCAPEIIEDSTDSGEIEEAVNLVTTSVDANGNLYGENGYIDDTYVSANSPAAYGTKSGYVSTGFMPVENGDSLYSSGTAVFTDSSCRVFIYDESKTFLGYLNAQGSTRINENMDDSGNLTGYLLAGDWSNASGTTIKVASGIAFVRVCAKGTGDGLIVSTQPI